MNINNVDTSKVTEFRTSKIIWFGLIALAVLFFVYSSVLFYHEVPNFKIGDYSTAYLVFVFMFISSTFLLYSVYIAYNNPVILRLNEKGIYYKSPEEGELLWKEIDSIKIIESIYYESYGNLFEIKLHDGRKFYTASEIEFLIKEKDLYYLVMKYFNTFR